MRQREIRRLKETARGRRPAGAQDEWLALPAYRGQHEGDVRILIETIDVLFFNRNAEVRLSDTQRVRRCEETDYEDTGLRMQAQCATVCQRSCTAQQ